MKFYWDGGLAAYLHVFCAVCIPHLLSQGIEMETVWPRRQKIFIIREEMAVSPISG